MDETIYHLLLWFIPILLSLLGFIGALAVNSLIKLAENVNDIRITIEGMARSHDGLEKRVEILEKHNL